MAKQPDLDRVYLKCAYAVSELSHATRRKVGAIIVAPGGGIIAEGVNGTPAGFDNCCEQLRADLVESVDGKHDPALLETKPECLHAESNAIMKVARSTNSSVGATIYCTLGPCFECAKQIVQAGIQRVVFSEQYPYPGHSGIARTMGFDLLEEARIQVDMLDLSSHNVDDDEITLQDEGRSHDDEDAWRPT